MRVTSQPLIAAYIVGRAADNAGALSAGLAWPRSIDPYLPRSAMPWAMGLCRAHAARSGASMRGAADGVCVLRSGGRGGRRKDEGALPRGGRGGRGGAFMRRVDGGTHHQVARGVRVGAPGCVAIARASGQATATATATAPCAPPLGAVYVGCVQARWPARANRVRRTSRRHITPVHLVMLLPTKQYAPVEKGRKGGIKSSAAAGGQRRFRR